MIPVVAIVGRPNVGKSTVFNCLTGTRDAIVADRPGITRDRQYGYGCHDGQHFIVIDTGGLGAAEDDLDHFIEAQTQQAIHESDVLLFVVDAREGVTPGDHWIVDQLRRVDKPTYLVANKIDGLDVATTIAEFAELGWGEALPIAASHKRGIRPMLDRALSPCFETVPITPVEAPTREGIHIAVIGRPNVGKSTLINRLLGEERVTVFDRPGTTRDSIFISLTHRGKPYTLIDTAGIRRRAKVKDAVEKFSVIKALRAIESCHVVVFLIDAQEGITDQDLKLLGLVLERGRSLVLAVNKWDGLPIEQKEQVKTTLKRRLVFLDYVRWHFISAKHGTGVGHLWLSVNRAYASAMRVLSTPELTRILEEAVTSYQPPLVRGRRVKLRYAHAGGKNPPIIVIHGNQVSSLPQSYRRYLEKTYRKVLRLEGTPVVIELRSGKNPYAEKRQKLTPRQTQKRKRLLKFVKRKKR